MSTEIGSLVVVRGEKDEKKNKFRTCIYGLNKFMNTEEAINKFNAIKKKLGTSMQVMSEASKKSGIKTKGKVKDIIDLVISFGGNDAERIKQYIIELGILQESTINVV